MNKYYTPTKKEFHIGFEYEIRNDLVRHTLAKTPSVEWYKQSVTAEEFDQVLTLHNLKLLRVKYLDKDDLESLGYKKRDFSFWIGSLCYEKDRHHIYLSYQRSDQIGTRIYRRDYSPKPAHYYQKEVFDGIVKNKSELIRLLQQLDIKK
jgi:hypothetical protein